MKSPLHQPKNKLKTLNPLIKLLCKIQTPHLMTLAKIKTLLNHLLQILKPSPLMIKVNLPVKTGTQMIKMIKRYLQDAMRISKPVVELELQEPWNVVNISLRR